MKGLIINKKVEKQQILCDSDDPEDEIKTIYHMADIHIQRFSDRHDEYLKVFENLCEEIKKDAKNAVICVCGDVLHDKSQLSAPQIMLCKKFFIMISDLCPVFVIIGNHDVAPQNNCIDALTPILMNLHTRNRIYLLLDDKNYIYNNICFGVTTMFSPRITPIHDKNTRKIKVGMYHGMLDGALSDNGYKIGTKDHWNYKNFKKYYDIVLLGDVHKQMWLDPERMVGYSGSLLQTRWGEGLKKGILKWKLGNRIESEFLRIRNDSGMIKLRANENGIDLTEFELLGDQIPESLSIRLEYENITAEKAEEHVEKLKTQYNVKSISLVRKMNDNIEITVGKKNDRKKIIDINDNLIVTDLIVKHMRSENEKLSYSEDTILGVEKKVQEILGTMNFEYSNQVKNFNLLNLRFKNYFIFDDSESSINYADKESIIGLIGDNFIGKSTCGVDVLLYSIYGISERGEKGDIIRIGTKETVTNVEFEINGDTYSVSRTRKRQSNKKTKKDTTEDVILKKNGENISKDTVAETNKEITKIVCEYDDFINTTIVPQEGYNFINLLPKDQKNLISRLLKLDVFSEIISRAKSQKYANDMYMCNLRNTKDGKKEKKSYDKYEIIKSLNLEITGLKQKLCLSDLNLKSLGNLSDRLLRDSINFTSKKNEMGLIVNESDSVEKLVSEIRSIDSEIRKIGAQIHVKEIERSESQRILEINEKILHEIVRKNQRYIDIDIESKHCQWVVEKQDKINALNQRLGELLASRVPDHILKQMFSPEEYVKEKQRNCLMKDRINEINEMIVFKKARLNDQWINENKDRIKSSYEKYQSILSHKDELIEKIRLNENNLIMMNNKLGALKNHIYDENCKYCMSYPLTGEKIKCQEEIKNIDQVIKDYETLILVIDQDLVSSHFDTENQYMEFQELSEWNKIYCEQIKELQIESVNLSEQIYQSDQMIKNYESLSNIHKNTQSIDKESLRIKDQINVLNSQRHNDYEEYLEHKHSETLIQNKISIIQIEYQRTVNQIDKLTNILISLNTEHKTLGSNLDKMREFQELEKKYKNIHKEIERNASELMKERKINQEISNNLLILGENLKDMEKKIQEYVIKEDDNKIIDALIETVDKKGLIDHILSNTVMPKIENDVNELLDRVSNYRIRIEYDNGNFKIYKIINNEPTNIRTISGYEKFVCNLCFKLALNTGFNNFLKTKFLIIDEAFTSCDDNSINNKLPMLFNYIRENYKFAIVITHEERIKSNFDKQIEVVKLANGNSQICC
jgi:DNA repair exonuclease SbcCD ATPase subunit